MNAQPLKTSSGNLIIDANSSSTVGAILQLIVKSGGNLIFTNLPTSNPGVSGAVWNNGGVLNIV